MYFSARPLDLPIVVSDNHVGTADDLVGRLSAADPVPLFSGHSSGSEDWEVRLTQQNYLDL